MKHPHLKKQPRVRTVSDRTFGEVEIPGVLLRFSQFPELLDLEAPFLGEHNSHVLSELLGYSSVNIAELEGKAYHFLAIQVEKHQAGQQGYFISRLVPPNMPFRTMMET